VHAIDTEGPPAYVRQRRFSPAGRDVLAPRTKETLRWVVIEPSFSPWNSALGMVREDRRVHVQLANT
jgi:hypothetical protein